MLSMTKTEGKREGRMHGGVEGMIPDAEGCVLTVRCWSSGLVKSSYGLKGGRSDVGVTVMKTKSANTWTMRNTDTSSSPACNGARTSNRVSIK